MIFLEIMLLPISFFLRQLFIVWISSIVDKVIFIASSLLKLVQQFIDHRERQVIPKALCIKILCLALRFECVSCHKNSQEDLNTDWPPTICNKKSGSLVIFYTYISKFSLSQIRLCISYSCHFFDIYQPALLF